MPRFNLIDQPWLPCVTHGGDGTEVSLREALLRAHDFREIYDPSPLVTVSLHRLLLAILHRAYQGPEGIEEWRDIWRPGRFDTARLNAYLDQWQHRFDLFDPVRPFYQVPFIDGERLSPIWRLAQENASGNNATLFDHNIDDSPGKMLPAMAARYLVAIQAMAVAGGNSTPIRFSNGPITRGFTLLALGESIFETLTLNLLAYNEQYPLPRMTKEDLPAWEREEDRIPIERGTPPDGYLDYLTWQSRQIHLLPGFDLSVASCQVRQRLKLPVSPPLDPFKSYLVNKKTGPSAQRFQAGRALWRDSTTLLAQMGTTSVGQTLKRPEMVQWLDRINEERLKGLIEARPQYRLAALGLTSEGSAGRVILWRHEELPLPLALLSLTDAIVELEKALTVAENVERVLDQAAYDLAELLIQQSPDKDSKPGREIKNDIADFASHFAIESRFWPRLDEPFARLLTRLPEDQQSHPEDPDDVKYGAHELPKWRDAVRDAAEKAFTEATASLDRSARSLKAVAVVQGRFSGRLARALQPLMNEDVEEQGGEAA